MASMDYFLIYIYMYMYMFYNKKYGKIRFTDFFFFFNDHMTFYLLP
jgi:hypothetical protein